MKPLGLFQDAMMVPGVETLTDAQCRVWYRLICLAATQKIVGSISVGEARMAETVAAGDANLLTETLDRLQSIGCVDVDRVDGHEVVIIRVSICFMKRKGNSETSTKRVRKFRERKKLRESETVKRQCNTDETSFHPLSPSFPPSDSPSFAPAPPRDGSKSAHAREETPQTATAQVRPSVEAPDSQTPPSPRAPAPPAPTGRETPEGMLAYLRAIDDVDPGANTPTPAQAEAILRLIWNSFPENREALARGYWQRQCCHSDVAWRAAIKATLRSQPNVQSIRYIEAIATRNPDGEPERRPGTGRPRGDYGPEAPRGRLALTPEQIRLKSQHEARLRVAAIERERVNGIPFSSFRPPTVARCKPGDRP